MHTVGTDRATLPFSEVTTTMSDAFHHATLLNGLLTLHSEDMYYETYSLKIDSVDDELNQ